MIKSGIRLVVLAFALLFSVEASADVIKMGNVDDVAKTFGGLGYIVEKKPDNSLSVKLATGTLTEVRVFENGLQFRIAFANPTSNPDVNSYNMTMRYLKVFVSPDGKVLVGDMDIYSAGGTIESTELAQQYKWFETMVFRFQDWVAKQSKK